MLVFIFYAVVKIKIYKQVEIDEYQNYEKAVGALTEAFKCLTKSKIEDNEEKENKLTSLKTKIALVKKFVSTRRYLYIYYAKFKKIFIFYNIFVAQINKYSNFLF